jgi:uncharacterized protein
VAILAGAIAAVSGFGIGSLLTPLLVLSMPTAEAVAVVAIPHFIATALRLAGLRRGIHWPTFRQFGIASAIGGLIGAAIQAWLRSPQLSMVLGILLISAGSSELAQRRLPLPTTRFWRLLGGALSGLFGGMVGNQGGIRAAALLGFNLSARELVATSTASAILVDAARVPIYLLTSGSAIIAAKGIVVIATIGVIIGTLVGVPALGRIPPSGYRRMLGTLLVLLGLWLLVTAIRP